MNARNPKKIVKRELYWLQDVKNDLLLQGVSGELSKSSKLQLLRAKTMQTGG